MEPLTMMVASIGLHFFNNYANNKKNKEIQEKQREFQRAAAEHDFERMRRLQAESAKLALELEAEVHKERVEDINNNYDTLLENFAHSFTVRNWPLSVLPFVMKGESFGSLFNGTTQSVNLHCILTPSNCEWFNANFYDDIDLRLEAEMNSKWNAQSTHPIVYYGGAWNRRTDRTGISVPKNIDLVDIDLIKTSLKNVPVVVITPYFDPWLHFKVRMWGMGEDAGAPFRIDIPHGEEVNGSYQEPAQRIFSFDYHKDKYELTAEFENKTVDEFVPYLECLIGFIADKYFWSMYNLAPMLPITLTNELSLNNRFSAFFAEKYKILPHKETDNISSIKKNLDYVAETTTLYTEEERNRIFESLHHDYIRCIGGKDNLEMTDVEFINKLNELTTNTSFAGILEEEKESISQKEKMGVWFCASNNEMLQRIINTQSIHNIAADTFIYEIKNEFVCIGAFFDKEKRKMYTSESIGEYAILMNNGQNTGMKQISLSSLKKDEYHGLSLFQDIDCSLLTDMYANKTKWLKKLIVRHNEMEDMVTPYLKDAPIKNVSYNILRKWAYENANGAECVSFVLGYDPKRAVYYIVGVSSDNKNIFSVCSNTIDEKLINCFENNLVLTIKL